MKILKERSRVYNDTTYYKFKVNIPEVVLGLSGIAAGDIVEMIASDGSITLKKVENPEKKSKNQQKE